MRVTWLAGRDCGEAGAGVAALCAGVLVACSIRPSNQQETRAFISGSVRPGLTPFGCRVFRICGTVWALQVEG